MLNYTFIIPHRNTPELLKRCIDSIPKRDDVEVIIVDDNSDPNIVDFEQFPGKGIENFICIFDKEGRGAGHARNIGLAKAKGTWLVFADADDYFTDNITAILDKYQNSNVDMVLLNAKSVDENGKISSLALNRYVLNYSHKRLYSLDVLKYGVWSPWSRMVKRHIAVEKDIKFEEVPVGNDTMFVLNTTKNCKSFEVEGSIVYMYYQPSQGSQTHSMYNHSTILSRLEQKFKINKLYTEVGYGFKWPIHRPFINVDLKNTTEYQEILRKYNYNRLADLLIYIKYIVAKILGIL